MGDLTHRCDLIHGSQFRKPLSQELIQLNFPKNSLSQELSRLNFLKETLDSDQ